MDTHEFSSTPDHAYIVGVFSVHAQADQAIEALKQAGFGEDTINLTEYEPSTAAEAEDLAQQTDDISQRMKNISQLTSVSARRIIVHVEAEGREQEAVDILVQHGSNNSDIPPGTELVHGSIMNSNDR